MAEIKNFQEEDKRMSVEPGATSNVSTNDGKWHEKLVFRFATFMVEYPYVNIILVLIVFIWASVIGFIPKLGAQKLPDFAQPTKGFLPRDTTLSNRKMAFDNLMNSHTAGNLADRPFTGVSLRTKRSLRSVFQVSCNQYGSIAQNVEASKIIYEHKTGGNLMVADRLKEICRLHKRIIISNSKYGLYVKKFSLNGICPSNSIPTYISLFNNRSSCSEITAGDITRFVSIIKSCTAAYKSGAIKKCVDSSANCKALAHPCNSSSIAGMVYNSLYFLSDSQFINDPNILKLALISDDYYYGYSDSIINDFYKSVYKTKLKDLNAMTEKDVKVAAYDFWDLKFRLFNSQLFVEIALLLVAILLVFIFIMVYSGSVFIGLMTFLCVIVAAVMAYFFYGVVFRLPFFPFLNVLTFIFLVGIGADDAFVFMGAWKEAKKMIPFGGDYTFDEALVQWMAYTVKHAIVAMFVTSFTTAAAFYANATSKIIAIRCFGVYAGTCILLNYLLMIVWFPVAVVISEKYLNPCMARLSSKCFTSSAVAESSNADSRSNVLTRFFSKVDAMSQKMFEVMLPKVIMKLRLLFLIILTGLGVGGLIVLFVSPRLRLPISSDFQMFSSKDSLEQYALYYKSKFSFAHKGSSFNLPLYFVFGVKNHNTASMMNPDDKGRLVLKPSFSIHSKSEQIWLKSFCSNLQNSTFFSPTSRGTCYNVLRLWQQLSQSCGSSFLPAPCCNQSAPMDPKDFTHCFQEFTKFSAPSFYTLLYDKSNNSRALVIFESSNEPYTEAYDKSNKIFNEVETWMAKQLRNAPENFRDGWFRTDLSFYDLQKSLATGAPVSLAISVAIAFGVVLFTTWNILISLYSIICIIFVISVSIGILVLSGWRLNILESIILAVAAGLSVDFTLHYGVAYRTAIDKTSRRSRIKYALVHLGSAVTMGAVTTFISGLVMAPASVLVYIQASHFLMTLMFFSWLYATFFFLPLCGTIGPTGNCCQLTLNGMSSGGKEIKDNDDTKTMEDNIASEEHELDKMAEEKV